MNGNEIYYGGDVQQNKTGNWITSSLIILLQVSLNYSESLQSCCRLKAISKHKFEITFNQLNPSSCLNVHVVSYNIAKFQLKFNKPNIPSEVE